MPNKTDASMYTKGGTGEVKMAGVICMVLTENETMITKNITLLPISITEGGDIFTN